MLWSNVTDRQIAVFTADQKEKVSPEDILIDLYKYLTVCGREWYRSLNVFDGGQYPQPVS
jgi:hypothetical protein